jgi:hypothetical protein
MENPEVKEVLKRLSEHNARILAKIKDPEEKLRFAKLAINEGLCVRELDKLVGRPKEKQPEASKPSLLNQPDFTRGFIKQKGLILLSGRHVRICLIRMDTFNTLIANLKKTPYEVGKYVGEQAADVLREEFEPYKIRNWRKAIAALNSNSGWGEFTLNFRDGYLIKVENAVVADPEFLRGYLEGCLGVPLIYIETKRKTHIFKVQQVGVKSE